MTSEESAWALRSDAETLERAPEDAVEAAASASIDETLVAQRSGKPGDATLSRGVLVGRYVVLQELGAGGMGVVYAAYDPELDRKVAIKLLLPSRGGALGGQGRTRLLREAQALAKLAHPNVVAVHDVGTHEERVWMAMEFVQGQTLAHWLGQRRSWREVLDVLEAAGRGLAAAHRAGLLHRDFKPENVMIGVDGRVRVMDFGLARAHQGGADAAVGELLAAPQPEVAALAARVTQAGALMGTPAYMAPEQFKGGEVSAAADLFAFCVTLWEALYGERPFAGQTVVSLAANVIGGKRRSPPKDRGVPAWLRRVCERGLAVAPADRWPSMEALLDALRRAQLRSRTTRWLGIAAALVIVGVGVEGARRHEQAQALAACAAEGDGIDAVWSDGVREAVRGGLLATGFDYAPATAERIVPWIDDAAAEWRATRRRACEAGTIDGSLDADLLDRARWCLDVRRLEIAALADELSHADAAAALKAITAASRLPPSDPCLDPLTLAAHPAPPRERARDEIASVRAELARADTLSAAGKYGAALAIVEPALARAEALRWTPLVVEIGRIRGALLDREGRYGEAEAASLDAYMESVKVRAWETADLAATDLALIIGYHQARHAEGEVWVRHAESVAALAGDPSGLRAADRLGVRALIKLGSGDLPGVKELRERELELRERALGPEHPKVATTLTNLASVHVSTGDFARAMEVSRRDLEIKKKSFGPRHPLIAGTLSNMANVSVLTGKYDEARALQREILEIYEGAAGGRPTPEVADVLNNMGVVALNTGEYREAAELFDRSLAIREQLFAGDHPSVADSVTNLGAIRLELKEYDEARRLLERAVKIYEAIGDGASPALAANLVNLGALYREIGELDAAKVTFARAQAIAERALGPEHPDVAHALIGLAEIALTEGDARAAVPLAERALALREAGHAAPELVADARLVLGIALWDTSKGERARAEALVREAAETFRALPGKADAGARAEAWLAGRGRGR